MLYSGARKPRNLRALALRKFSKISGRPRAASHLVVGLPHLLQRPALRHHLLSERDGALAQFALGHDLIDEAHGQAVLGRHVRAGRHHLQRLLDADDARQALRATCAGQQAEVHLRQPAAGGGHGHAVVGAERDFQAAAQRRAVDRGDHRLGRAFHGVLHVVKAGAALRPAELGDVGAGDEGAAVADDHHRLGGRIGQSRGHAASQAVAHVERQRVHRRRVQGDDPDIAFQVVAGHMVDLGHRGVVLAVVVDWRGLLREPSREISNAR